MPSKTTDAGSAPSAPRINSLPLRSAQIPNCSAAAARKVSAATSTTRLRRSRSARREFPDGRRLSASVDADEQHHRRTAVEVQLGIRKGEETFDVFTETRNGLVGRRPGLLFRDQSEARDDLLRRRNAEIGEDQRLFELVPEFVGEGHAGAAQTLTAENASRAFPRDARSRTNQLTDGVLPGALSNSCSLFRAFFSRSRNAGRNAPPDRTDRAGRRASARSLPSEARRRIADCAPANRRAPRSATGGARETA